MNEEEFLNWYYEDEERDRNVHRLIDGEFDSCLGDDGLPDSDHEQRVQREIEEFEDRVLAYMRGQITRMANEREPEHGLRELCMN